MFPVGFFFDDALQLDTWSQIAMVSSLLLLLVLAGCSLAQLARGQRAVTVDSGCPDETDRPVIGILSMELSTTIRKYHGDHDSYIAASYVKFIEGAGAQVAPILIGQPTEYYREMVHRVNGLLLPGGKINKFTDEHGYGAAGRELYRLAVELNQRGVHFPVLGICLGMEMLALAATNDFAVDVLTKCDSDAQILPLSFLPGSKRNSRMLARAPTSVIKTLERENVTINHHTYCITRDSMASHSLTPDWLPLSVNEDTKGKEFVSALEHRSLPFYGVIFHPEKNIYEWKPSKRYPHSPKAVASARYFADFLVAEARRNGHSFPEEEERNHLIYRHQPVDTERHLMWEQLYFFSKDGNKMINKRLINKP